jgi:hypothetical protein
MAAVPANPPQSTASTSQNGSVRLANVTALYTDKLTDGRQ